MMMTLASHAVGYCIVCSNVCNVMLLLTADSLSIGAIIGIVIGFIIFTVFIITCCICWCHPKCPLYHARCDCGYRRIFSTRHTEPRRVVTTMPATTTRPVQMQLMPVPTGRPNNLPPATGFLYGQTRSSTPGYPHGWAPYEEPPYVQPPMEPPPPYNPVIPHGQQPNAPLSY